MDTKNNPHSLIKCPKEGRLESSIDPEQEKETSMKYFHRNKKEGEGLLRFKIRLITNRGLKIGL